MILAVLLYLVSLLHTLTPRHSKSDSWSLDSQNWEAHPLAPGMSFQADIGAPWGYQSWGGE